MNYRNLYVSALAAIIAIPAAAAPLTPEQSLTLALGSGPLRSAPKSQYRLADTRAFNGMDAVYIFSKAENPGFIVTAADNSVAPLLGYGNSKITDENGNFSPEFNWWINQLAKQTEYAARNSRSYSAQRPVRAAIEPLCQTRWNQDAPYNNLCPKSNQQATYTGCVATATSQVMKYHNWPTQPEGSQSYSWGSKTLSINYNNITFSWSDMLNNYADVEYTSAQGNAVAQLMVAVGYGVEMNYGTNASGASSLYIGPALTQFFKYDKSLKYVTRDMYTELEWEDMIYNSLSQYGPVVYNGQSSEGGHSFVCDGYSENGYFHINWGWGGVSDGYFLLSALDPFEQGIGGSTSGFDYDQDAIIDIRPDTNGTSEYDYRLISAEELSYTIDTSARSLTLNNFCYNPGPGDIPADFGLGFEIIEVGTVDFPIADPNYVLYSITSQLQVRYGFSGFGVDLSGFSTGKYLVRPAFTVDSQSLKYVQFPASSPDIYILTAGSSDYSGSNLSYPVPQLSSLQVPDSFGANVARSVSSTIETSATAYNPSESDFNSPVYAIIMPTDSYEPLAISTGTTLSLDGSATDSKSLAFNFSNLDIDYGNYRLCLAVNDGSQGYWPLTNALNISYVNSTSGICLNPLSADDAQIQVFDLQGRNLGTLNNSSLHDGILIFRQGSNTAKVRR